MNIFFGFFWIRSVQNGSNLQIWWTDILNSRIQAQRAKVFNICRQALTPNLIKKSWMVSTRYGRYATAKWSSTQDIQTFELLWSYSMCSNFFKAAESHTGWKTNSSFPSSKSNDRMLGKVLNLNFSTNRESLKTGHRSHLYLQLGMPISRQFVISLGFGELGHDNLSFLGDRGN